MIDVLMTATGSMLVLAAALIVIASWVNNLGDIVPDGWKIRRRGRPGQRGWDAYDPNERRWLGWRFARRSFAVDHAWKSVNRTAKTSRK
jgi:hypothetical protein